MATVTAPISRLGGGSPTLVIINSRVGNVNSLRRAWGAGGYAYGEGRPISRRDRDGDGSDGVERAVCGWGGGYPSQVHHARHEPAATDREEKSNTTVLRHGLLNLHGGGQDFGGVVHTIDFECIPDLVVGIRMQIISGHDTYSGAATISSWWSV